jgi:hypothetical protein
MFITYRNNSIYQDICQELSLEDGEGTYDVYHMSDTRFTRQRKKACMVISNHLIEPTCSTLQRLGRTGFGHLAAHHRGDLGSQQFDLFREQVVVVFEVKAKQLEGFDEGTATSDDLGTAI